MKYSKLCSTCQRALQPDWEEEKRNSPMWPLRPHHRSLKSFLQAVSQNCFICWKIHKIILTGYVVCADDHLPSWFDGSEADWETMHFLAQHDHDTPAILILFACAGSKEGSNWIPFYLMPRNDNCWVRYAAQPQLQSHTSSPSIFSLISKWIETCEMSHQACRWRKDVAPWQPTRLLDIGRLNDKMLKLVMLPRKPNKAHAYITLSYKWGSNNQLRLLTSNINTLCQGSLIELLPKTFREAVIVARTLGVRYLWIDALCIIQDSQEDWERESASMGSIYANALCNIAASASDGPEGGLFRRRDPDNLRLGCVRVAPLPDTRLQTYHLIDGVYAERQLRYAPLFRRGWVFQERMLAARVIYFAEEQVFWECCVEHKCEAFPAGVPFATTSKDQLPKLLTNDATAKHFECNSCAVFREWNLLVQRYSECQFTRASDKLPAFSGIASYFGLLLRDGYVFGMWKSRIIDQLGYTVERPAMKRSFAYRAPSWSWASLDGPIMSPPLHEDPFTHISVEGDGLPLGQLRLRGVLTHATYSHATTRRKSDIILESGKVLNIIILRDHLGIELKRGKNITLLAFQAGLKNGPYLNCFVLEPILCAFPAITYRRIGFAYVFQHDEFRLAIVEPDKYDALGVVFKDGLSSVKSSRLSNVIVL